MNKQSNSTMKRKKFDGIISVPEDLIIEILSLLPVVSLLRFRCVCKSWYALFETPIFIAKHLMHSNSNIEGHDHRRLIIGRRCNDGKHGFMSLSDNNKSVHVVVYEDLGFPYGDMIWNNASVLGVFNGVVCLSMTPGTKTMFWNPATRETKVVSPGLNYDTAHGFAYDFKTNGYVLITLTITLSGRRPSKYQVGVYSLSDDSWRKSNAVLPEGFGFDNFCPRTCVKGIYSTSVSRYDEKRKVLDYILLTFDVSIDVFVIILFPEGLDFGKINKPQKVYFEQLNDSFAIIVDDCESRAGTRCVEVLVLNEYGASGFWTRLYTIELPGFYPLYYPLGFWKNNILCSQPDPSRLTLVDLGSGDMKEIQTDGRLLVVMECEESLVSFNGRRSVFHSSQKKAKLS